MDDSCFTKFCIKEESQEAFAKWQARLHALLGRAAGFVSVEIVNLGDEWRITERFRNFDDASGWLLSDEKKALHAELIPLVKGPIQERMLTSNEAGVTEVFVTEVPSEKKEEYQQWISKIHELEATFAGFRGVYIQSPATAHSTQWLTLVHFDTQEHLEGWLSSSERKKLLEEASDIIHSLDSHRVHAGYSDWFSSIIKAHKVPPVWKQTMLVLLVLYPIVMLQILYLNPLLTSLELPVSIFICNVISVSLISWPFLPIAINALDWWLNAESFRKNIVGTLLVACIYLIEICLFLFLV